MNRNLGPPAGRQRRFADVTIDTAFGFKVDPFFYCKLNFTFNFNLKRLTAARVAEFLVNVLSCFILKLLPSFLELFIVTVGLFKYFLIRLDNLAGIEFLA